MHESTEPPQTVPPQDVGATEEPLRFRSEELLQGRKEIIILHRQEIYRLRVTKNDKLILHK